MAYNPGSYWNGRSASWKAERRDDEHLPLVEFLKRLPEDGKVLDIGSGDGGIHLFLKPDFPALDYRMCDISEGMIEKCETTTGIRPDLWDGITLPYEDDSFDAVIAISVWLHVPFDAIERFLRENVRVTRRYIFAASWFEDAPGATTGQHCFQHDYHRLFEQLGLEIVEERQTYGRKRRCWVLEKED